MAPVVIAGGGIAGLSAALAIARAGRPVLVCERDPHPAEEGAGIQLSPNASRHLRTWGVLDRLDATALEPKAVIVRRGRDGAVLAELDLGDAEARWGAPFRIVHRADLHAALRDTVAGTPAIALRAGVTVTGWRDEGALHVTTSQGGLDASALIVADGARSALRGRLHPGGNDVVHAGRVAWRALVPAERCAAFAREPASNLWLGPNVHLVHYPLRGRSTVNLVAIVADRAIGDESDPWSRAGDPAMIVRRFATWDPVVRDLLALATEWRVWPLVSREPPSRLAQGRVALAGDAAHPMMPFLAQGAAQAVEDAVALGAAFAQRDEAPAVLAAYGEARIARVKRVVAASERQAAIYHLRGPAALARDLAMRTVGGAGLRVAADWIWRG